MKAHLPSFAALARERRRLTSAPRPGIWRGKAADESNKRNPLLFIRLVLKGFAAQADRA